AAAGVALGPRRDARNRGGGGGRTGIGPGGDAAGRGAGCRTGGAGAGGAWRPPLPPGGNPGRRPGRARDRPRPRPRLPLGPRPAPAFRLPGRPPPPSPSPAAAPKSTDTNGEQLPAGVIARLGSGRMRHTGWVYDVCFSPDGKRIASVGTDADGLGLRVWDGD